ncbi:unnamed protein product [Lasius platythorax]|uniref:Secreted protein n=1 Tax=Lasius platythorax TaxID=488582 RepID=A0AAV2PFJ8_9HYME
MSALFGHPFTDMHLYAAPLLLLLALDSSPGLPPYRRILTTTTEVPTPSYNYYARSLTPGGSCGGCGYTAGRSWIHYGTLPSLSVVNASSDFKFLNALCLVTGSEVF